ncbi:FUSC family protein [Vibrio harveyi]|uniref:FUSC family protein n=1 Tax=Vibrio harveyi TaxID=669 RepID=UPI001EFC56A2|nr:FUSC family protein [Vibrio harveyi]MCG9608693.1 FUSC family protein [Vibrio harveyi]MCG9666698.1 FUSC family protein [Vibrio harveyi]
MNEKIKFATKVALSLTLAYLIPFAMGWPQASTAATTVMLIASTGSRRESLAKGTLRVLGTLVGAVIGLLLVGMFAQDRLLYMLSVSVVVSFIFYFRNAYQKDPTLLALTGVMVLMMSNGGDAEGAFMYGVDRAYMTIFGVVLYTLVGTFLWPTKTEQNLRQLIEQLNQAQQALFNAILQNFEQKTALQQDVVTNEKATENDEAPSPTIDELLEKVFAAQNALEQRFATVSVECSDVSAYMKEWQLAVHFNKQITQELSVAAHSHFSHQQDRSCINNFEQATQEIQQLFKISQEMWDNEGAAYRAQELNIEYNQAALADASHLVKGSALTLGHLLKLMHQSLSRLTQSISCIDSVTNNVSFKQELPKQKSKFLWWDAENFKTAVKTFTTYWVAGLIWIYFNPPGGYSFVTFSTIFMSLLSFVPVPPFMLLILFTFGFLFAVPSYVFILPGLELGAELGLFIFIYTFIGFYLFKGPVTIFYMIGLFVLGLDNNMTYHFGILMTIMTLFYMVVFMIIFAHYFPFSSRPEHLFLTLKERYFRHVGDLFASYHQQSESSFKKLKRSLHLVTLNVSSKKLTVWGSKINHKLFDKTPPEAIGAFSKSCNALSNHVNILIAAEQKLLSNRLIKQLRSKHTDSILPLMAGALASHQTTDELNSVFEQYSQDYQSFENKLEEFFSELDLSDYAYSEIAGFYILLNLKRNVFEAINQCKQTYEDIDWVNLRQKRF